MENKYQSIYFLVLLAWFIASCTTDRKDYNSSSQFGFITTEGKYQAFPNSVFGKFGNHFKKSSYLLQLLEEMVSGPGYDEVSNIKTDELRIHNKLQDFILNSTFYYKFKALEIAKRSQNHILETVMLNIFGGSYIYRMEYPLAEKYLIGSEHIISKSEMEPYYEPSITLDRISWLRNERIFLVRLSRALIVAVILLSVFIALLFVYFRQKQKSVRLQNELLTIKQKADKLKIENTELLLKKQEERSKKLKVELESKESLLASKLLTISKQNEFLIQLLNNIKNVNISKNAAAARNGLQEIIGLIRKHVQHKNWDELEIMYASGNSVFIRNLNKAHPDLTANEKRLCLLLHMNFSTKGISDITMQNCRAIEIARYRLRQKFLLERNANLNTYLAEFS